MAGKKKTTRKRAAGARKRTDRAASAAHPGAVVSARNNVPSDPAETAGVDTAGETAESRARSTRGAGRANG